MEETSEELPNFSIGIDLLGPDPTSSKNRAELKKTPMLHVSRICRKTSCSKFWPKDILWEQNRHQLVINNIKRLNFRFYCCLLCTFVISGQSDWSRKISLAITTQITQKDINLLLTKTSDCCQQVFSRSRNDQAMFVNEYEFKEGWQS